jgi:EmrB/QacA subfamily drug resistance transporter
MLPMFMAMGDQTIVASALPAIAGALGDVERVSWIIVAYLLAATISAPLYGYLGDSFGRRRLMFVALGMFTLGAILNSLAPSVTLLAAARFVQGLGGGGLMSLSQALIGEVVPPRQRGKYQGYLATIAVVAAAIGPVAGAFLADAFGWRAVFLVNVPTAILAFALMFRITPRPVTRKEGWNFDAAGLVWFVTFIVSLLLALEQVRRFDAVGFQIAGLLGAVALLSLTLLVRQEKRSPSPLLPVSLMRQRAIWTSQAMAVCHGAALVPLVAFTPLYMRVMGLGAPSQVGAALLTVSASIGLLSMITGRIVTRTGRTMIIPSIGSALTTVMFLYVSYYAAQFAFDDFIVALALTSMMMGTVMGVVQVTAQTVAGRRMLGAAAGSIQLARSVGASFGTALFGAVLCATVSATDPAAGQLFLQILQSGGQAMQGLEPARQALLLGEIAGGFRAGFLMLACFTALGAMLAWSNPSRRI